MTAIHDTGTVPDGTFASSTPEGQFRKALEDNWNSLAAALHKVQNDISATSNVINEHINVLDYGADPTGVADSKPAFAAAFVALGTAGGTIYIPNGTYIFNSELLVTKNNWMMVGAGRDTVILKANTNGMRSVLCLANGADHITLEKLTINANRKSNFGLCLKGCGYSDFRNLQVSSALFDGIQAQYYWTDEATSAINQFNRFWDVSTYQCGVYYATSSSHRANMSAGYGVVPAAVSGTISTTANNVTVTGSGTSFTTLGLRRGDILGVGSDPTGVSTNYGVISSVDSDTQITLSTVASSTVSGSGYVIARGGGIMEIASGNIGLSTFMGGLHRSNAGPGLAFGGLYGPKIQKVQMDFTGTFGIRFGEVTGTPVYGSQLDTCYFEAIASGAGVLSISGQLVAFPGISDSFDIRGAQPLQYLTNAGISAGSPLGEWVGLDNNGAFFGLNAQTQALQYALIGTTLTDAGVHPASYLLIVGTNVRDYVNKSIKFAVRGNGNIESLLGVYVSRVADGASAVAHTLTSATTYATTGAKLLSLQNNGAEQAYVDYTGVVNCNNAELRHKLLFKDFIDDSATTGNRTVNANRGISAFGAGATTITITNNQVGSTAMVVPVLMTNDATAAIKNCTVAGGGGAFTITLSAATTGITKVGWTVIN